MSFVLFLHIAAAIFLIGPLTVASSATARAVRDGTAGLPLLRWLQRTTRIYGAASVIVLLLGLGLVRGKYSFNEFWIGASIALFLAALGLLFGLVDRDQRRAIARIEGAEKVNVEAGRIAGVSAAIGVLWLVILLLMIYKPGHSG
jgi:hypothetical protein